MAVLHKKKTHGGGTSTYVDISGQILNLLRHEVEEAVDLNLAL